MTTRTPPESGPIVIGVCYPPVWYGNPVGFEAEIEQLRKVDPRIEVIVETYEEDHELRTIRGRANGGSAGRDLAPELTPAQRAMFESAHAVITLDLPYDAGSVAPNLAWVQGVGAGSAQLQTAGLAEAGIRLSTSAGSNAVAIAEFVVGRIIGERKRFREIEAHQVRHEWAELFGTELAGATVGLIGYGAINAAVAKRLRAFDCEIMVTRRSATTGHTEDGVAQMFATPDLHLMLAECDTVVAAVPETPETIGIMDEAAFAAMRPGSFFVNVGRGTLVEEPALIAALESGHLRGAALDVASEEPLPADNPLWDAPNLYLSYHCSSAPAALFVNLHRLVRENLERWLGGETLRNEVDLTRGY